jgi:membrane protease YdiL (CAAX protease family)
LPVIIITIVRVVSDFFSGRLDINDPSTFDESYISGLMGNTILISLFFTAIVTILTIVFCRYIEGRSLYSMGFVKEKAVSGYFVGLLIGTGMFAISTLIAWLSGTLEYRGIVLGGSIGLLILYLFGFLFQGMSEEVLVRGYLMVSIAAKKPIILAVIINSALFAIMHLLNSGITVLSVINLILFGIFASVYMLRNNSIWGVCALHSAWNFTQGNVFGILVSGQSVNASILSFEPTETGTLINGGRFGLEGGLAVTIVLVAAIVISALLKGKTNLTNSRQDAIEPAAGNGSVNNADVD